MAGVTQPPYPLHPSIASRIHPEYAAFYNKFIINQQQVHLQPVAASRTSGILIPGGGPLLPVGKTEDISIPRVETEGPDVVVRVFTPADTPVPEDGYGVMLYAHGGGWVLGNINTENTVCTNICNRAGVVVVSVDYRLAPEHPFPAAVHDCWEALLWLHQPTTISRLNINVRTGLSVGGSSAGGNLAAVLTHKALLERRAGQINIVKQALSVPVMDNTATPATNWSWKEFEFTAALPALKMMWYRKHYLPDESQWKDPEASPLLYPDDDQEKEGEGGDGRSYWAKLPPAVILVGELDVLRAEGEAYAEKLRKHGVKAELHVMKGMPHPFLAMDAVLEAGREAITLLVNAVKN